MKKHLSLALGFAIVILGILGISAVSASVSDGTILPGFSDAKVCHSVGCVTPTPGVINFRTTNGTPVTVSDASGLSGTAWGNELGWIDFKPAGAGVDLDTTTGIFSGKAWSQAAGWINFSPTGQQVSVNSDGEFEGWAWSGGPGGGWIKFDCDDGDACVKTDWRKIPDRENDTPPPTTGGPGPSNPGGDVCPNITGNQPLIPSGYVISARGECILPEQCSELDGELKQPMDVVLVMDISGSMSGGKLDQAKAASIAFINDLVPGSDRVAFATLGSDGVLVSPFSATYDSTKALVQSRIYDRQYGTDIGGGLKVAQDHLRAQGRSDVKRVIILLSDGAPTTTATQTTSAWNYSLSNAAIAKAEGTTIYTVGLMVDAVGGALLKQVASLPSQYYYSPTGEDLNAIYLEIATIGCSAASAQIAGSVIHDGNANGQKDAGETKGVPLATVVLTSTDGTQPARTIQTASDGAYSIRLVTPGPYTVCMTPPSGMYQTNPTGNGCYPITVVQGISHSGIQFLAAGTLPSDICVANPTDPLCVPAPTQDFCPNIEGVQTTMPTGMQQSTNGNCVPIPGSDDVGAIKISSYLCENSPTLSRQVNGPKANGAFTVPGGCSPVVGAEYGAVFIPDLYQQGPPYLYIHGQEKYDVLGTTGSNGELIAYGLSSLGRQNIAETYNGGIMVPHKLQYGLMCYRGSGNFNDNFEHTFVPKNGMTYCVGYRAADMCSNIAGAQNFVPEGMYVTSGGECITPQDPQDLCPNIPGNQTVMPNGKIFDAQGQCVDIEIPDACPNIPGYQSIVPNTHMYDEGNNCIPRTASDMCPNLSGVQEVVPSGYIQNEAGECVQGSLEDMCPNLAGEQYGVPLGMIKDGSGACIIDPTAPNTDLCLNISGVQISIPAGFMVNAEGECIPPPWTADICPNIPGDQTSLPPGMVYDGSGNCVDRNSGIPKVVDTIKEFTRKVVDTVGRQVTTLLTALGIALPVASALISFLLANPVAFADIPLMIARGWSSFLTAIGWKKRRKPWGTVYDSITKRPIDPAYVVLTDMNGVEIASAITDINGRYGFAVDPGTYRIRVNKTNYEFPSTKLAGKTSDDLYEDLYFGDVITITEEGQIITKNIPMDQLAFDWNEYTKSQKDGTLGQRLEFYRKTDTFFYKLSRLLFWLGFAFSIVAIVDNPSWYNTLIVAFYFLMVLVRYFFPGFGYKGSIHSRVSGHALPFSIVRVKSIGTNMEVSHKVADRLGNYYGLVQNGTYNIVIDEKVAEQGYTKHELPYPVVVHKGYLKEKFKV